MNQEDFFNRYQYEPVKDKLGAGGFGIVYKAYDTKRERYVAIKEAPVRDDKFSLQREAELVTELRPSENLARYENCYRFTFGRTKIDYAVMTYYEAGNLKEVIDSHSLNTQEQQEILQGILQGISHLHEEGVIHRDLKAENILLEKTETGKWIPNLSDLGLSFFAHKSDASITNSSVGLSFAYAAPEQIQGTKIRKNVDLWAYGVMVYFVMTGELPFQAKGEDLNSRSIQMALGYQIINGELPSRVNQIAEPYQTIINKCLVKDNKQRVQTAAELLALFPASNSTSKPMEHYDSNKTVLINREDEPQTQISARKPNRVLLSFAVIGLIAVLLIGYNLMSPKEPLTPGAVEISNITDDYNKEKELLESQLNSLIKKPDNKTLRDAVLSQFFPNAIVFKMADSDVTTSFRTTTNELLLSISTGKLEQVKIDTFVKVKDKITSFKYYEALVKTQRPSIRPTHKPQKAPPIINNPSTITPTPKPQKNLPKTNNSTISSLTSIDDIIGLYKMQKWKDKITGEEHSASSTNSIDVEIKKDILIPTQLNISIIERSSERGRNYTEFKLKISKIRNGRFDIEKQSVLIDGESLTCMGSGTIDKNKFIMKVTVNYIDGRDRGVIDFQASIVNNILTVTASNTIIGGGLEYSIISTLSKSK